MLFNLNTLFLNLDIIIVSLFSISIFSFILLHKANNDELNSTDKKDDTSKNKTTKDTSKQENKNQSKSEVDSDKKKAYMNYIKNYINKNKNYYNVKFNLEYYLLKKKKYHNNHFNLLFNYLIDFSSSRIYTYKSKHHPFINHLSKSKIKNTFDNLTKGTYHYLNFLKLINKQNSNFIYSNLKNNNYSNNIFFYNLIKKINFKYNYKFINNSMYNRFLGSFISELELTYPLTRFKVEFKFLKSLMNSIFRGIDPSFGYFYKFFNYRYYKGHVYKFLRKLYYRNKSPRYLIKYYLNLFRDFKAEFTSSYKTLNAFMFLEILNIHQSNFPFLPIEGTKLFFSDFKRHLGVGDLRRIFVDFLSTSNLLNFGDRNNYDHPLYSGYYSYYNRLYKYFTNYRSMLSGPKIIETQIFLFLTRYFPSIENILILKNHISLLSSKDYLFGITRYTFPTFYDFKFYLPFPVSELANMLGLNEEKTRKNSYYSFYFNLKPTFNLLEYLNVPPFINSTLKSFLISDKEFMNFKSHRNYLFRQLLGSFSIAMRKLEFQQQQNNKYSIVLVNIFQFLYGKNSEDLFNITSSAKNIGNYEASPAFVQLRNISFSLSYRRSGFLNKLTRLPKRYERHLTRQFIHNYMRFFFKPKRNINKIFFKLNSSPMKLKINFYDFFKEIFNTRFNISLNQTKSQLHKLIDFSMNHYLRFYLNSISSFKFKYNFKFILLPNFINYNLISFFQKSINSIINEIHIFFLNFINIYLDKYLFTINLNELLTKIPSFFLFQWYRIIILSSIISLKTQSYSFIYIINFFLYFLDTLIFIWFYETMKTVCNAVYTLIPFQLYLYSFYLISFLHLSINYVLNLCTIFFIFLIRNFHILKYVNVLFILVKTNVFLKYLMSFIFFFINLDYSLLVKRIMEYICFYSILDIEYYLDLLFDRLIYLWWYQHCYWYLPSWKFSVYFWLYPDYWYSEFFYPICDIIKDFVIKWSYQFWIMYTQTILHKTIIFYKLHKIWSNLINNPNFILKAIIGYILILYYHIYYSVTLYFPIIYLIIVSILLFFILSTFFIIYGKHQFYKNRPVYRYPFFYYNLLTLYIVRLTNYYINFMLGYFFTYVRLAAQFIFEVNKGYYLNHCRSSKYHYLKKHNITYKIDLKKFK